MPLITIDETANDVPVAPPLADTHPTLASAPAGVSAAPTPGQGIQLDSSGSLPAAVQVTLAGAGLSTVSVTGSTTISATTEATANTVVTSGSVQLDGKTPISVVFFAPVVETGTTAGDNIVLVLYQSMNGGAAASIGFFGQITTAAAATTRCPVRLERIMTPSSGSYVFSVRGYKIGTGNGTVIAGPGGAGSYQPGFIKIYRA